jgi:purine-binding chemotaxis protein CheW
MATVANKMRKRNTSTLTREDKIELVDFKMVTFSLAGKDYGIDIMKVKEIAKFVNFTYVPNTPPFVRGVYNLRGEIISIIDLRGMFNLPHTPKKPGEEESGLILRLDNHLIGVVVDKIDKVVGIHSSSIQPPHPIFGDINIKYINGVVENDGRLYIILDVEKILTKQEDSKSQTSSIQRQASVSKLGTDSMTSNKSSSITPVTPSTVKSDDVDSQTLEFIKESLLALEGFHTSRLNEHWISERFNQWKTQRKNESIQLTTKQDAEEFLKPFSSPFTGSLWSNEYASKVRDSLPKDFGKQIQVWNPGCGRGHETYCLAALLKDLYPMSIIKIWASDKDLLSVSAATNLVFQKQEIPTWLNEFMVQGSNGYYFNQEIKDSVLFEYHDVLNAHSMPPAQLTITRDLFSYLPIDYVQSIVNEIAERVKGQAFIMLGQNELGFDDLGLEPIEGLPISLSKVR